MEYGNRVFKITRSDSASAMHPKNITVIGRRWFERTNGNTYHSVKAWIDGELKVKIAFCYGYGSQYLHTAQSELERAGLLPGVEENEFLWRYCERNGIKLIDEVADVQRKKDL